jgi:hypothetical protein
MKKAIFFTVVLICCGLSSFSKPVLFAQQNSEKTEQVIQPSGE